MFCIPELLVTSIERHPRLSNRLAPLATFPQGHFYLLVQPPNVHVGGRWIKPMQCQCLFRLRIRLLSQGISWRSIGSVVCSCTPLMGLPRRCDAGLKRLDFFDAILLSGFFQLLYEAFPTHDIPRNISFGQLKAVADCRIILYTRQ